MGNFYPALQSVEARHGEPAFVVETAAERNAPSSGLRSSPLGEALVLAREVALRLDALREGARRSQEKEHEQQERAHGE